MKKILPLTRKQIDGLPQEIDKKRKPFRILANGQCANIVTGALCLKKSNIMYQPVHWDKPKEFVEQVTKTLQENNPKIKFKIIYH